MPHLPETHNKQHQGLGQRPPQNALVGTVAGLSEAFLAVLHCNGVEKGTLLSDSWGCPMVVLYGGNTYTLVVLLLRNLINLIQQLSNAQLQLGQLLFLGHIGVVDRVLTDLNVQMHTQLGTAEPSRTIRVHAEDVLARYV